MKFAFTARYCFDRELPAIAAKAREYGYDGVEVSGIEAPGVRGPGAPANLVLGGHSGSQALARSFAAVAVEIACVVSPVRYSGQFRADAQQSEELLRWIDLAAELACPRVMLRDPVVRRGQSRTAAGMALGDWLAGPADHALSRGVTLLICNDSTLTSARDMWALLERLQHPAVACCWDFVNAERAGESPAVSVPTLNSRIQYVRVGDVKTAEARLAVGTTRLELFLTRLRGIGYNGYVSLGGSPSASTGPREALEVLKRFGLSGGKQETRPKAG